jgi:predicted DNA-binding transcriptional regulator AlpA
VLLRFTISRATLERRLRDGSIPRPVRLGALRRWSAAEVERFEQRLLADRLAP